MISPRRLYLGIGQLREYINLNDTFLVSFITLQEQFVGNIIDINNNHVVCFFTLLNFHGTFPDFLKIYRQPAAGIIIAISVAQ